MFNANEKQARCMFMTVLMYLSTFSMPVPFMVMKCLEYIIEPAVDLANCE